jgi:hypothetical protein
LSSNPFASYNLANLRKEGDEDDERDSKDEEEKAASEPEITEVKEQLEPSPYIKLVTVNLNTIVA